MNLKSTLIKSIFLLAALLTGYYFFVLKPNLELPRALSKIETEIAAHHSTLLQNRINLVELAKLDPNSPDFSTDKDNLFASLKQTNTDGLQALDDTPTLPDHPPITDNLTELFDQNRQILEQQQQLITELETIHTALKNIYLYDPRVDLDGTDDKKRVQAAITGLTKISSQLEGSSFDPAQTRQIQSQILATIDALTQFTNYALPRPHLFDQFAQLKNETYQLETNLLKSDQAITNLTNQTNLILEYDLKLNQIQTKQRQSL